MSGPVSVLGLITGEQNEMPAEKSTIGDFKRNIASARGFLKVFQSSCGRNPTTFSFFMALITSWKARRLSTEDFMNRLLFTLTTPVLQEAFNLWLPRGFRFEPAQPGRKVRIAVVEETVRDAVWAQAVGGVFVAACRELVDEGRAVGAEASPVTEEACATGDRELDPTLLYFFWYADVHIDIWRWAPAVAQFLGRVLLGYRGGFDRQLAREKGMSQACPVAAALLGDQSPDINDLVEMIKRRLAISDEASDGSGGDDPEEETLETGGEDDADPPDSTNDSDDAGPPDLTNDSDDETVLPDSSPEPESPEVEQDVELEQEMSRLEEAELDTRALLCGLHFVHRVFQVSSISHETDILEETEALNPKSKKNNKKRKGGRKHKKKRTEQTPAEEKHPAEEHCTHQHDPYLRFLDLVLMHAYELERSHSQEDIDMWQNLLFWRFEQMFKDTPDFVDNFKKFWEAPEKTLDDGRGLNEDSFSYLLGL